MGIDTEGHEPFLPHSDKKLWWPHTEALYALLLVHRLTGEAWCAEWYDKVHAWAFSHFRMPGVGEWRQRLTREGQPTSEVVALPVKDPFHLPRAAILIMQLLKQWIEAALSGCKCVLVGGAAKIPICINRADRAAGDGPINEALPEKLEMAQPENGHLPEQL
jgi:hypothetical protein